LNEKVEDTVAVDIDQLRTGMLEAAEKREGVLMAGGVEDWKRRNRTDEGGGGCRGW